MAQSAAAVGLALLCDGYATSRGCGSHRAFKRVTRPGGTAGRVGARHGVDEVPWVQGISST